MLKSRLIPLCVLAICTTAVLWAATSAGAKARISGQHLPATAAHSRKGTAERAPGERPRRAPAVRTIKSPREPGLNLGLAGATDQLASGSSSSIATWDGRASDVSTQIVRVGVDWAAIAPSSPSSGFDASDPNSPYYKWSALDQQITEVTSAGFKVLLEVSQAPAWAEGSSIPKGTPGGTWEPNASDFGQFATAVATRYDGSTSGVPKVSYWQAWNEPNLSEFLNPQWTPSGAPSSPGIYRGLENAFYSSVKAVSSSNYVVAAGTAPYGDPTPGGSRMQPVTFDQNLFCLNTNDQATSDCAGPTYLDAIDDHPYVSALCCLGPTWHAQLAADTSIPDMYKIVNLLKAAESAGTAAPAGNKGVWASELGWNTNPPNPDTHSASSPLQVAKWATQALYILWSQGVNTVLWYELADPASQPAAGWDSTYEEGLFYGSGVAKPAAQAFRFPFMTNRRTSKVVEAWGRAPKGGVLWIQQESHGKWRSIFRLKVTATQVFELPITLSGSANFRAVVSGIYSPVWTQSA